MYVIGIDLGGTNIKTGLVDESGKIIEKVSIKTMAQRQPDEIIADMAKTVPTVCQNAGIAMSEIHAIGVGVPGTCQFETGNLLYTNNIPLSGQPIGSKIQKLTGIPTYISNDANCAVLGEAISGGARGYRNVVLLTLGTGVGGGVIIEGKLFEGSNGAGAELGHTMLIRGGASCTCGRDGCLEAYASATALISQTKEAMLADKESIMWKLCSGQLEKASGMTSFAAAREGDASGKRVADTYISYLADGVTDMINIFQPEIVLLGGGVSNEGDALMIPLREQSRKNSYGSDYTEPAKVERALLGNDAGIIGAAMLYKNVSGI